MTAVPTSVGASILTAKGVSMKMSYCPDILSIRVIMATKLMVMKVILMKVLAPTPAMILFRSESQTRVDW